MDTGDKKDKIKLIRYMRVSPLGPNSHHPSNSSSCPLHSNLTLESLQSHLSRVGYAVRVKCRVTRHIIVHTGALQRSHSPICTARHSTLCQRSTEAAALYGTASSGGMARPVRPVNAVTSGCAETSRPVMCRHLFPAGWNPPLPAGAVH